VPVSICGGRLASRLSLSGGPAAQFRSDQHALQPPWLRPVCSSWSWASARLRPGEAGWRKIPQWPGCWASAHYTRRFQSRHGVSSPLACPNNATSHACCAKRPKRLFSSSCSPAACRLCCKIGPAQSSRTEYRVHWTPNTSWPGSRKQPQGYLEGRFDKTRQPAGDPDCKAGCKRGHNRRQKAE